MSAAPPAPVAGLQPPYYAVIFTSLHSGEEYEDYERTAARMVELAQQQDGFLGIESAAGGVDGLRITVSYWRDLEAIARWRAHAEHRIAQEKGNAQWYSHYQIRICRVERGYGK